MLGVDCLLVGNLDILTAEDGVEASLTVAYVDNLELIEELTE